MSDIGFAFEIGGRTIDPSNVEDPVEAEVIANIVESIVSQAGDLVCPEHNEAPRFLCAGESIDSLTLEVEGCCDAMVDKVKAQISLQQQ
ncbi:MAG: hypothetical protein L3J28_14030 [Candidatus Polarisedimenticolaceae bacterium]|nr:hypothetical protein [Candidatus Polarisedimenticolaceae bacterium]